MINWGVIFVFVDKLVFIDDMFEVVECVVFEVGFVELGDNIVIVVGVFVGIGGINIMCVCIVK